MTRWLAAVLEALAAMVANDEAFAGIAIDGRQEFRDVIRLRRFENLDDGIAEMTQGR